MYFLGVHFLLEALEHSLGAFIHAHFLIYWKKISEWQFWYSWCQKKEFKGHKLCLLSLSVLLLQLKTAKEILICSLYLQSGVTRDVWVGCQVLFNLSWGAKMLYSLGRTYLKKLQLVIKKYYNKNLLLKLLWGVTVGLHLLCCVFTPTVVELWGITELSAISLLIPRWLLCWSLGRMCLWQRTFSEHSRVCGLPQSVCSGVTITHLHPVGRWQLWVLTSIYVQWYLFFLYSLYLFECFPVCMGYPSPLFQLMRSCCSWHKTSLGCTGSPVGVLHQSQGQTGHARCAATALGFPVPMPFVQEPFFFFFASWWTQPLLDCSGGSVPALGLLNFCCGSLLCFGFLEWMWWWISCPCWYQSWWVVFFPSLALVIFQAPKKCYILKALKANALF